jgi:hypothetical protein
MLAMSNTVARYLSRSSSRICPDARAGIADAELARRTPIFLAGSGAEGFAMIAPAGPGGVEPYSDARLQQPYSGSHPPRGRLVSLSCYVF